MENIYLLALINLFSGIGNSLASPFFPSLNIKYNLTDAILGWIISTYSLASTLFNSIVPLLINKFSHIKLLYFAAFFEATCTILYSFLIYFPSYKLFIFTIFLLRIIHGCCSSLIGVVVYSLAVSLSEKEKTKINLTNMEIGWSLGKIIGPIIGAICFKFGGYISPFLFLGVILYSSILFVKNIKLKFNIKEINNKKNIDNEIGKFIFSVEAWIILFGFTIGIVIDCYFYPCLTYHLNNNYGLSISLASLFFTVPIIVYIITVHVLNNYQNKLGIYFAYLIGLLSTTIGPLLIYPIKPIPKNIFLVLLGLILIGIGQAPIFVQGFLLLTNIIRKLSSNKDDIYLNDISSTLNNITIDIGGFIGPIIGGFLTTKFNFNICCFIMFIFSFIYLLIFMIYFWKNIKSEANLMIDKNEIKNDSEMEKLIEKKNEDE